MCSSKRTLSISWLYESTTLTCFCSSYDTSRPWQKIQCFRALSHSRIVQGPQKNSSGKAGHLRPVFQNVGRAHGYQAPLSKKRPYQKARNEGQAKRKNSKESRNRSTSTIISKSGSRLGSVGGKQVVFSTSFPLFWPWTLNSWMYPMMLNAKLLRSICGLRRHCCTTLRGGSFCLHRSMSFIGSALYSVKLNICDIFFGTAFEDFKKCHLHLSASHLSSSSLERFLRFLLPPKLESMSRTDLALQ